MLELGDGEDGDGDRWWMIERRQVARMSKDILCTSSRSWEVLRPQTPLSRQRSCIRHINLDTEHLGRCLRFASWNKDI